MDGPGRDSSPHREKRRSTAARRGIANGRQENPIGTPRMPPPLPTVVAQSTAGRDLAPNGRRPLLHVPSQRSKTEPPDPFVLARCWSRRMPRNRAPPRSRIPNAVARRGGVISTASPPCRPRQLRSRPAGNRTDTREGASRRLCERSKRAWQSRGSRQRTSGACSDFEAPHAAPGSPRRCAPRDDELGALGPL